MSMTTTPRPSASMMSAAQRRRFDIVSGAVGESTVIS